jgi:MFS family permease
MSDSQPIGETSLRYRGWRVVLACFAAALFCWGLGLYGHGVYIAELNRLHGWSTALISGAVTLFYLVTAILVVFVNDAIARFGPRRVMLTGACCFGAAVAALAAVTVPWQLYAVYLVMAFGAATMHVGAISNVVGLWFDRQRGLALSLALNGASSGGILVTPLLVLAIAQFGFRDAMLGAAALMAVVLGPAILCWIERRPAHRLDAVAGTARTAAPSRATWTRRRALQSPSFWSVVVPFTLGLTAQVGFLVHQFPFLQPVLGRTQAAMAVAMLTVAAIAGRFVLGALAPRLDMRRFAAVSLASQAASLAVMTATTESIALLAACVLFGLSAGNLITLPSLVIQREFEAASFGMLVGLCWAISQFTYAFGPGLLGAVRDLTGSYAVPLAICIALDVLAAALVLLRPRGDG